ncbi:arginase family protein [Amycolatopsis acidiphila]|uniref:Arginase family protein n=1 Tax=Amycolatopsis acidiphila TaxID=715473 RepID=A0A558AK17_9PSEU|nr:arginase family protein [Amycolatopsis acidiphila]
MPFHQDERLPDGALPLPGDAVTPDLPDGDLWRRLNALYDDVAGEVARRIDAGERPTVVSGDCLMALPVLAGAQRAGADPSVIWFDAHGDAHTPASSTSGYVGGMALRFALGEAPRALGLDLRPLPEERVTLVDARDLDPAEAEYLASAAIRRTTVAEAAAPEGPVVLHVDLDVIDAGELPGLLFPVSGGPSRDEVVAAVRRVLDSGQVVAFDVACPWHPGQDNDNRARLLAEITG